MTIFYIVSLSGGNTGGYLAHIGGGIFSFIYIKQLNTNKIFKVFLKIALNSMKKIATIFTIKNKIKKIKKSILF